MTGPAADGEGVAAAVAGGAAIGGAVGGADLEGLDRAGLAALAEAALDRMDSGAAARVARAALARLDAGSAEAVLGDAAALLADPDGLIAVAGRLVDRLAYAPLGGEIDDVVLGASVVALDRLERRAHAEKLRRLAAAAERDAHAGRARSTADWLAGPLGLSPAEAKTATDTAVALARLPATLGRLADGALGVGQAGAAAAALADLDAASDTDAADEDAVAGLDGFVAAQSPTVTRHELRTRIDAWQEANSSDVLAERTRRAHRTRNAFVRRHRDGTVRFGGRLDPAGGAHVTAAIDALARREGTGDERTPAQRRADAFVELARRGLDGGELPEVAAQAPHVIVITPVGHVHPEASVGCEDGAGAGGGAGGAGAGEGARGAAEGAGAGDAGESAGASAGGAGEGAGAGDAGPARPGGLGETVDFRRAPASDGPEDETRAAGGAQSDRSFAGGLPEESWLDGYGPVPSASARMFACNGHVTEVVVNEHGAPLQVRELGKPTLRQRRAVIARDRACIGCGAPASRCQVHHIVWRRHDGATVVENLTLVCHSCHHNIHHEGWTVVRQPDGHYAVRRPSAFSQPDGPDLYDGGGSAFAPNGGQVPDPGGGPAATNRDVGPPGRGTTAQPAGPRAQPAGPRAGAARTGRSTSASASPGSSRPPGRAAADRAGPPTRGGTAAPAGSTASGSIGPPGHPHARGGASASTPSRAPMVPRRPPTPSRPRPAPVTRTAAEADDNAERTPPSPTPGR